ncbi:hypothetical protein EJB05_44498 [Eragrostis curvula]|uniref:CASP-like protein n=1 Tax=Eragrostis curvula TaxID=38414 RepID=A0A5J9TI29_9POAL|nr:hypothetical protein EJB05_44498 [Eragrostis curvula]
MKDVVGSPGTWSGLALRVSQCLCAAASFATMFFAAGFGHYTAFGIMLISMEIQCIWSFSRAMVDIDSLRNNIDLHNLDHVCMVMILDWVSSSLFDNEAYIGIKVEFLFRDALL